MRTKSIIAALLTMLLLNGICNAEQPPAEPKPSVETVAEGNTAFALDLYAHLRTQEGNLFFSPYSISTALAMVYAGAEGETASQMKETLHFFDPADEFHKQFGRLEQKLNKQGQKGDYQLSVANALWIQKNYGLLKSYLKQTQRYSAEAENVDFKKDAEQARRTINAWVEKKTNEKIKDLIPKGVLDAATRLVLTNAIYFKGNWQFPFKPDQTRQEEFHISTYPAKENEMETSVFHSSEMVPMMRQTETFAYGENNFCQVLEMTYKGDHLSMVILLPKNNKSDTEGFAENQNIIMRDKNGKPLEDEEMKKVLINQV